jgi:hypothetical protein
LDRAGASEQFTRRRTTLRPCVRSGTPTTIAGTAPCASMRHRARRGRFLLMTHPCSCPADLPRRCSASDQTHDARGRPLCCPYDERAMAAFYCVPYSDWTPSSGRRAAMRKRLEGTLEEIAQRAADTRAGG